MTNFTNKNLEFLSNEGLINVLQSVLNEIDVVGSSGSHRSTTYLAVSAVEGLFGELRKLLGIAPTTVPAGKWPQARGKDKDPNDLTLEEMINIFDAASALPQGFDGLYHPVRQFRNYMHPARELKDLAKDLQPIERSVAFAALACLNALIEKFEAIRFVAAQQWRLIYGLAQVPSDSVIHMPQTDFVSLLVSEYPAERFREMNFRVHVPPGAIVNLIYSYSSQNDFMAARIEGREGDGGKGLDNGRLRCTGWRTWSITSRYKAEPKPNEREHTVRVVLDPLGTFDITVDHIHLELEDSGKWDFDHKKKLGFLTEWGLVSIVDLKVQTR